LALLGAGAFSAFAKAADFLAAAACAAFAIRVLPPNPPIIEAEPDSTCHGRSGEIVASLTF
jgi:hypothetical protein